MLICRLFQSSTLKAQHLDTIDVTANCDVTANRHYLFMASSHCFCIAVIYLMFFSKHCFSLKKVSRQFRIFAFCKEVVNVISEFNNRCFNISGLFQPGNLNMIVALRITSFKTLIDQDLIKESKVVYYSMSLKEIIQYN